jgi:hypothetical protein
MQQGSHEGQTGMAHVARFPGRVGPTHSPSFRRCRRSLSRWMHLDLKPSIKGPLAGREKEQRRNIETRNRSLGDQRLKGKTPVGRCRCDLHPL